MIGFICLGTVGEHATKEAGREGASNTDPALTETTYDGGQYDGC